MANDTLGDGIRKFLLAGVGAVSVAGEKAGQVMEQLAERGEVTVSKGRQLNQELTRKVSDATSATRETLLKAQIELMPAEERAAFAEAVQRVTAQVNEEQAAYEAAREERTAPAQATVVVDDAPADAADSKPADASATSGTCGCSAQ